MHKKLACFVGAVLLAGSVAILSPTPSLAQGAPSVSMVQLQTLPGENGQQMVVLPRGKVVPLPGPGVNGNAVNIYMGSQGGYWYTDRNGQNVDLTSAVQYLQRMQGQASANGQAPVVNNYYNNSNPNGSSSGSGGSSSSSGSSAAGTALAAGLGAAGGAALTNSLMNSSYNSNPYYHGVPYGMPVYYGAHNQPYYVDHGGNNVYVNNSQEYNRNVNAQATQNNINNQHINAAEQNNINNQHANNLQQQQKWYQQQASSHSDQFNNWQKSASAGGENPFVHQDAQNSWSQRHDEANGGDGGGRFGRRGGGDSANGGDGGGRFGRRGGGDTADGGGGRGGLLGGRDGGSGGGGGLLGGREGGGGGGFRGRRGR